MKLLFCDHCGDVVAIRMCEWRKCMCGHLGGQYNEDSVTATIGGVGRVFGIANPFFELKFITMTADEKFAMRHTAGYGSQDCWWGDYKGDTQLLRIKSPAGPRLSHRLVIARVKRMQAKLTDEEHNNLAHHNNLWTPKMLTARRAECQQIFMRRRLAKEVIYA
jgi:hypothetical protein